MSAIEALTAVLTAELPGSPGGVRALADSWRHSARAVKEAADLADAARAATTTWTGRSAEAFTTTARTLTRALDTDVETLGAGARALDLYAQTLDAATATAENLRRRAAVALTTAHADPTAAAATATEITTAWNTLRTTITTAATRTAALLTTTNTNDTADTAGPQAGSGKKDKEPPATDEKTPLSNSDINRPGGLKDQADGEADWDPDANQGKIGDCYLLATLQAYSQTEEGRQYLRNHVTWDEDRQAFTVTFPDSDEPVYVSDYYTNGAKDSAGKPTIMSIYERAYGIHYGDKTLNNGGDPRAAMENITSEDTRSVNAFGFKWGFIPQQQHQYTDDEWDDIQRSVEDGKPVVASTNGGDFSDGDTVQAATDTNADGKIDTDNKTSDGRPPDQEGTHRIVGDDYDHNPKTDKSSHSYTVVTVDDDYVTLRNPWGRNDTTDDYNRPIVIGRDNDHGLIRITRADYEKYFNHTDIGETP